jgi:pilus assembly protein CpaF
MAALVAAKSVPQRIVPWIQAIVDARLSILLTGGTGCGKTTWLSVLLDLIDADERIVLVEDSAELHPQHAHVVRLEARPPNVEGSGAISLRDLVRQALRMRPDRLVVGEVRGAEVVDLLAAMNTGHEGGFATVHANSAADVPARLEALGQAAGLDRTAVHSQLIAGVDVVIHLRRDRDGRRRWSSISVASRTESGCEIRDALLMHNGRLCRGPGLAQLQRRLGDYAPDL